jgi:hypothetical protein
MKSVRTEKPGQAIGSTHAIAMMTEEIAIGADVSAIVTDDVARKIPSQRFWKAMY